MAEENTRAVDYYGFGFKEFNNQNNFSAIVQYQSGGETLTQLQPTVDILTEDHLAVRFQAGELEALDPRRHPQLALKWGEGIVSVEGRQPEITIILQRVLEIEGRATIIDDELSTDVREEWSIEQQKVILSPLIIAPIRLGKCVGEEVRLEIDLVLELLDDLSIKVEVTARLFEGADCDTNDLEDTIKEVIHLPRGAFHKWRYKLVNSEPFGNDSADITLTFRNSGH